MKAKKNKNKTEIKIEIETPVSQPLSDSHILCLERMAERLILIIENGKIKKSVRDAIFTIADNAILNARDSETRAEFIQNRFVRAMKSLDPNYTNAIMHSLMAVMESCIDEKIYQPILNKTLGR